jgi:hypothetical protein
MNNIEFDNRIKDLLDSYQESAPAGVWDGIEAGLQRRKRTLWVKRIAYGAVAASLLVGLVLDMGQGESPLKGTVLTSSVAVVSPSVEIVRPSIGRLERIYVVERGTSEDLAYVYTEQKCEVAEVEESQDVSVVEAQQHVSAPEEQMTRPIQSEAHVSLYDQWNLLEQEEDSNRDGRGVVLDISSNFLTIDGGTAPAGGTSYIPGTSMDHQSGIVPYSKPKFSLPLSLGLNLQIPFAERFSVGTGVRYTYLQSSFQALIDNSSQVIVDQRLHYLGIPLSVYFDFVRQNRFSSYITAGALMEKGLQNHTQIRDILDGTSVVSEGIKGLQWSVNLGVGVQYMFTDMLGIYLDPALVYFFNCDQPFSIRTTQPLQFELEIGLRFKL